MKLIIDIPEEDYNDIITCNPEVETEYVLDLLMKCVDNGTPIPDNATVCDIEQIRAEIADLPIRPKYQQTEHEKGFIDATNRALQIIDKYTKGAEE